MKLGNRIFLALALSTGSAHGAVIVAASASSASYVEVMGSSSDFGGASHLYAKAYSSGNTAVGIGSLDCGANCASFPDAKGYAEADGSTGRLKAYGGSTGIAGGGDGNATILDAITFLSPNRQIKIRLDGSVWASNKPEAYAAMSFLIFLQDPDGPGEQVEQPVFEIYAYEQDGDRYHSVATYLGSLEGGGEGFYSGIPGRFEFILNLPNMGPLPYALGFSLSAGGGCDTGYECSAHADFLNTAYLGIEGEYISANGYSYLGAPPDSAVPEPQAWTLAALGLTGVALLRGRR